MFIETRNSSMAMKKRTYDPLWPPVPFAGGLSKFISAVAVPLHNICHFHQIFFHHFYGIFSIKRGVG
jgi:hypothetical protein